MLIFMLLGPLGSAKAILVDSDISGKQLQMSIDFGHLSGKKYPKGLN